MELQNGGGHTPVRQVQSVVCCTQAPALIQNSIVIGPGAKFNRKRSFSRKEFQNETKNNVNSSGSTLGDG